MSKNTDHTRINSLEADCIMEKNFLINVAFHINGDKIKYPISNLWQMNNKIRPLVKTSHK